MSAVAFDRARVALWSARLNLMVPGAPAGLRTEAAAALAEETPLIALFALADQLAALGDAVRTVAEARARHGVNAAAYAAVAAQPVEA